MAFDLQFALIEVHNTDDDHEVGGQDSPYIVTMRYSGPYDAAAVQISDAQDLGAFNVRPGARKPAPDHIEFLTFERKQIFAFLGVRPPPTEGEEIASRYCRNVFARTVGDLRAATADLPDDFPLIHTGSECNGKYNRLGVHVVVNEWVWHTPERQEYDWGSPAYALRLMVLDAPMWNRVVNGTFGAEGGVTTR